MKSGRLASFAVANRGSIAKLSGLSMLVMLYVGTVLTDTGVKEYRCWQVEMSKASRKYRNHGSK